jgi:hypothetical protein
MLMVAMVSPTSLLPGKTLVMEPGPYDLLRKRDTGSGLNCKPKAQGNAAIS